MQLLWKETILYQHPSSKMSPILNSMRLYKGTFESSEQQCHISVIQRKKSTIDPGQSYTSVCWVVVPSGSTTFPVCSMVHRLCLSPVMLDSLTTDKGLLYRRTLEVFRVSGHLKFQIDVQTLLRGKKKNISIQGEKREPTEGSLVLLRVHSTSLIMWDCAAKECI